MLKIIHTSDLHIGAKFGAFGDKAEAQRKSLLAALAKIADTAVERSAHAVLISGDLFDSNFPSRQSVEFVKSQLKKLNDAKIYTVILPGTHDCLARDSVYRRERFGAGLPFVYVFDDEQTTKKEFPDIDLTVFARANTSNKSTESPVAFLAEAAKEARAKYKVALAHGSVQIEGKAAADDSPITLREIAQSGMNYIALGHWHGCQEFSFGDTTAWYAGSPEITYQEGKGGLGQGYALWVEIGGETRVEPVKISGKELRELEVDMQVYENMDNVYHEIEKLANPDTILRVNLSGLIEPASFLDAEKIEDDFSDKFFSISVKNATVMKGEEVNDRNYPEELVVGQFLRIMRKKIDEAPDPETKKMFEDALQIGIAELEGRSVL